MYGVKNLVVIEAYEQINGKKELKSLAVSFALPSSPSMSCAEATSPANQLPKFHCHLYAKVWSTHGLRATILQHLIGSYSAMKIALKE